MGMDQEELYMGMCLRWRNLPKPVIAAAQDQLFAATEQQLALDRIDTVIDGRNGHPLTERDPRGKRLTIS